MIYGFVQQVVGTGVADLPWGKSLTLFSYVLWVFWFCSLFFKSLDNVCFETNIKNKTQLFTLSSWPQVT